MEGFSLNFQEIHHSVTQYHFSSPHPNWLQSQQSANADLHNDWNPLESALAGERSGTASPRLWRYVDLRADGSGNGSVAVRLTLHATDAVAT